MTETKTGFEQWAILELMGHVRLAGLVSEQELFGQKLGRIDIPKPNAGFATQFFSGSSIYRLTPTTEEIARSVAAHSQPRPVSEWELRPALPSPQPSDEDRTCGNCGYAIEDCDCEPEDEDL